MPRTEILQIRNFIHVTVILYFHLEIMSKSVSLKILGLKLVKLDCIIYNLILIQLKKLEMSWMLTHVKLGIKVEIKNWLTVVVNKSFIARCSKSSSNVDKLFDSSSILIMFSFKSLLSSLKHDPCGCSCGKQFHYQLY